MPTSAGGVLCCSSQLNFLTDSPGHLEVGGPRPNHAPPLNPCSDPTSLKGPLTPCTAPGRWPPLPCARCTLARAFARAAASAQSALTHPLATCTSSLKCHLNEALHDTCNLSPRPAAPLSAAPLSLPRTKDRALRLSASGWPPPREGGLSAVF